MFRVLQIVILVLINIGLYAQPYTNQRSKTIAIQSDSISLDTLSIIPHSEIIFNARGKIIDSSYYIFNYADALIIPTLKLKESSQTIRVVYRVFPISFSKEYYNKDQKSLISPDSLMGKEHPRYIAFSDQQKPFGDKIEASGSISRGISFGNNQDMVVNSGLNLQISGELSNNIRIEGAISDRTIPLQPQGNTQKLEEFDRIYLRAYTPKFEVQAGDVEIKSPRNGMLRYNRNVQGLSLSVNSNAISEDDSTYVSASAAVAKGKFARNSFSGIEGNQGPYRLSGSEGETYIIIIAGSERIYMDGKLMTRGETNQYTIDYNTAELTFTPMMPVSGNSRISVEFEYTERSYARFIMASEVEQRLKSFKIHVAAFSEGDSKNQPFDQDLNSNQIALLQGVGDKLDQAVLPQVDSVGFNADKILYEKKDTTVNGTTYKIYNYSTNPLSSYFQVNFSNIGEGKGNYVSDYGAANGKVFRWVAPVNGKPSGIYEPVRVLVTPKRKQMVSLSIEKDLSSKGVVNTELAFSKNDLNTFSSIDKKDDVGAAIKMGFKRDLTRRDSSHFSWIAANAMFTSSNFSYIDRYRTVEFERDWNINQITTGGDEKEGSVSLGYKTKKIDITGTVQGLALGEDYTGLQNSIAASYKISSVKNELAVSSLLTDDSLRTTGFNRLRLKSEYAKRNFIAGVALEGEDNMQKERSSKKLLPVSFRWYQADFYIGNPDTLPNTISANYKIRKDWRTPDSLLKSYSYSQDFGLKIKLTKRQNSRLNLYTGYRLFNPIDTTLKKTVKQENTLLSRIDYGFTLAKGFVSTNLGYEIGSGLEPKYQFYYVEVPAGQGVFTWNDYNGNGIKELDEFEIASFKDEAKYVRINLSSNQYISVNNNAFSVQCDLRPDNLIKDTSLMGTFFSKFSNQFSYSTRQKNDFGDMLTSINPFSFDVYDSSIVSISQNYRNSLSYNRFSRAYGIEWINSSVDNKQILTNGYEIAKQNSNQIIGWLGLSSLLSLRGDYTMERKVQESEYFQFRNYDVKRYNPVLKVRFSGSFGFTFETGYEFEYANNRLGDEIDRKHSILLDLNYSIRSKAWLNISSTLSKIDYKGAVGTPVEYELLKGFKSGNNSTWEIKYRRKISTYFEMDIGYNGRYISTGRVVHTGSMQVRAVF